MTLPDIPYTETAGYELHEELEWYPGKIVDIEATEGLYGPQLKWIIQLDNTPLNDDGTQNETWAYCSQKLTPRSKLFKWATGILGKGNVPPTLNPSIFRTQQIDVLFERYMATSDDGTPVEKEKVVNMRKSKTASDTGTVTTIIGAPVTSATTVAPTQPTQPTFTDPDEAPF